MTREQDEVSGAAIEREARGGVRRRSAACRRTFLIGRDGAICAKQLGPVSKEDVERAIKALL